MKTKIVLLLWAVINCEVILAQGAVEKEYPYLEVYGYAEQSVVPDEITIAIKIKERYKGKEKITIKQQEDSLKYYLMKEGLELGELSLSNANADYVQVNWTKRAVLTETNYLFKAKDAGEVTKVFQIAEKFLLYDAYILKVNYSKYEDLRSEVRIKAAKNAKAKADQMLNAIGVQTGKPWIVMETASKGGTVDRETYQSMASKDLNSVISTQAGVILNDNGGFGEDYHYTSPIRNEPPADPYSVISSRHNLSFSKIKVSSNVYIKYEIK
ncbi:MAG TPA: SIMPL domain-containing protein [Bacteroidia bacterium]|nr:SIMPL domain-containing protein [Bacteroidia bacterium]